MIPPTINAALLSPSGHTADPPGPLVESHKCERHANFVLPERWGENQLLLWKKYDEDVLA